MTISLFFFIVLHMVVVCVSEAPIIGILTQETYIVKKYLPENRYDSFIAASYVKFLEAAGARVIPVWVGQNRDYYKKVINYTNGILFPGGGTYFNESNGYGKAAKEIYELVTELNSKGIYYPILGICLGMQVLLFADTGGIDIRIELALKHQTIPLEFAEGYENSKLYSETPQQIINILKSKNVTHNLHQYSITEEKLKNHKILKDWKILSKNVNNERNEFISSMEHVNYPIYGIQFHPEKIIFEFSKKYHIPHDADAIEAAQFFSNFFVNECRKNNHTFPDEELDATLIYNYSPLYTGNKGSLHVQLYVFTKDNYQNCPLVQ